MNQHCPVSRLHRRPRPGGFPWQGVHLVSTLQNTESRLFSWSVRSFTELSSPAFILLYCTTVRPHLECAMEANTPTLRADINQLERIKRLATWLARGLRHVPYEEKLRNFNFFSLEHRRCCCCCLGIAPRAKMLKMSAWLLHPKGWEGSTCRTQ